VSDITPHKGVVREQVTTQYGKEDIMKKTIFLFILVAPLLTVGMAHSNYILNPGFENHSGDDFAYWAESGVVKAQPNPVFEGTTSALLGVNGGSLYQTFSVIDGNSLNYGAYFLIGTTSLDSNWDQIQISLQIDSLDWTTTGGSVSNFVGIADFTYNSNLNYYISAFAETTPVPEPTTILLFGAGLIGLAGIARRKNL
jgi:hypothetical protein